MTDSYKVIGILGGTFDPIHQGHLACALHVQQQCKLSEVRLMPCHIPPHRASPGVSAQHRANMVELAITDFPLLRLETLELEKTTPSYTVESLQILKQRYPEQSLAFIIGMDSLISFRQWYNWQAIFRLAHLIVCQRPGYSIDQGDAADLSVQYGQTDFTLLQRHQAGGLFIVDNPLYPVSATALRQQLQTRQPEDGIPEKVLNYIQRHGLYQ